MIRKTKAFVTAALFSLGALSTGAAAMTVQPVVLDLLPGTRSVTQVITVTNTFAYAVATELTVEDLIVDAKGVRGAGKDSGDLLVFPPTAVIQPGQTQVFRVQYVGDQALARSRHYYVTVAQLPVKVQQGQSAVQILYNFQVLVSVAPQNGKPAIKVERAEAERSPDGRIVPAITFSNAAATHGYLSNGRIRVVQYDAAGRETFKRELTAPEVQQSIGYGLVSGGQTRRVTLPIELPSRDKGTIDAQFTPDK